MAKRNRWKRKREKKGKDKGIAVVLAIFFSQWTWIYTYRYDAWKFWLGLLANLFLFWTIVVPVIIWLWAIIDTATKPREFYEDYYLD